MKSHKFNLFIFILFLFSCQKDIDLNDITDKCEFVELLENSCFYAISFTDYDEIIVKDIETYRELADSILSFYNGSRDCENTQFPDIDFSAYHFIGQIYTRGRM